MVAGQLYDKIIDLLLRLLQAGRSLRDPKDSLESLTHTLTKRIRKKYLTADVKREVVEDDVSGGGIIWEKVLITFG